MVVIRWIKYFSSIKKENNIKFVKENNQTKKQERTKENILWKLQKT